MVGEMQASWEWRVFLAVLLILLGLVGFLAMEASEARAEAETPETEEPYSPLNQSSEEEAEAYVPPVSTPEEEETVTEYIKEMEASENESVRGPSNGVFRLQTPNGSNQSASNGLPGGDAGSSGRKVHRHPGSHGGDGRKGGRHHGKTHKARREGPRDHSSL